ncbi:transposable element Tcb1 transposase [Trichonephila clavipes]|nr:transposable element Tcb1 transposase [Trichonephila clavipes]
MLLRRFRRQYEQLSQFERGRIIGMMEAGWSARRIARQLGRQCCEEVLGPVDPRDVIYMKTRFRTPSTDKSSRRPSHRKKCKRIANCFIGRHPGPGNTFTRGPCVFSNHTKAPGWQSRPYLPLTPTHRLLRLEWCRERGNEAEWNQVVLCDESRFNHSSDDNRVRVGIPRGERLNPAFALQRHTTPTAGVVIWGAIAYNTRSPLVLICGTT